MTPENFVYWLQGYFELNPCGYDNDNAISPKQVEIIKEHLKLVFDKKTSDVPKGLNPEIQFLDELQKSTSVCSKEVPPYVMTCMSDLNKNQVYFQQPANSC